MRRITGFILAGGRSQRMGRDKAQVPWQDRTLLTRAIIEMKAASTTVCIVGGGGSNKVAGTVVLPDISPGAGPMGGLYTALHHSETDWNLVLAVDLPLVNADFLRFLITQLQENNLAIVPETGGHLQPLCGAYRRGFLPKIQQALKENRRSIHRLLEESNPGIIRVVSEQELSAAGYRPELLFNVNTPVDLERARALAKELDGNERTSSSGAR
jgi:molybdopterin-guanine dinucleotide biosynthesis protein A